MIRAKIERLPKRLIDWAQIVCGSFLIAVAFDLFFIPNRIAPGGLSGVATLIHVGTGWPVGLIMACLNVPIFLIAARMRGATFLMRSLAGMLMLSLLIDMLPIPGAIESVMGGDVLLATVYGGLLMGAGVGLVLRGNATTGGTDMIAQIINWLLPHIRVAWVLFAVDLCVVVAAGIVFNPKLALYALVALFLSARATEFVQYGLNPAKACFIISEHSDEIARRILSELERGVTALYSRGMYSGTDRKTLLCIVSRIEIPRLKRLVESEDPQAFVVVSEANEVLGEGFTRT
ncbi:MAG: YitT family protein [Christensenellales bacterium]|jgi:uncharacterized membrane-anchored protein YitT (DUF2179 family)